MNGAVSPGHYFQPVLARDRRNPAALRFSDLLPAELLARAVACESQYDVSPMRVAWAAAHTTDSTRQQQANSSHLTWAWQIQNLLASKASIHVTSPVTPHRHTQCELQRAVV